MNGRASKMLKEISNITGKSYRGLKRAFLNKSHTARGNIRRSMPDLRSQEAELITMFEEDQGKKTGSKAHANISA